MSRIFNLYLGKAGQMAVMSRFLIRGWNVAIPEVDVGDDLFVVEDKKGIFFRVQVKTAQAVSAQTQNSYSARFKISLRQLSFPIEPEIYYAFVVANDYQFPHLLLIRRSVLLELYQNHEIGSLAGDDNLLLYFIFQDQKVMCSKVDFTSFLENFKDFGVIPH
jgi:hypothetical protein